MHHSLKLYGGHRYGTLRLYMFLGSWTKVPVIGRLVRWIANTYGKNMHGAYLLTPQEAEKLIDMAGGLATNVCSCRELYRKCENPRDNEILLGPVRHVIMEVMSGTARETTKENAREIIRESHRRGLVLTVLKCRNDFYAICSCCSCCCVPMRLSKQYGIGNVLTRHKNIVEEFVEYQLANSGETEA